MRPPFQCPPPTGNPAFALPAVGGALLFTPGAPEPGSGVLLLTGAQPVMLNPNPKTNTVTKTSFLMCSDSPAPINPAFLPESLD